MERDYKPYGTPYFEEGVHEVSVVQASSPDIKTVSSVKVKSKDKPLSCEEEENFSVEYTVVGEKPSSATLMFLVSGELFRFSCPEDLVGGTVVSLQINRHFLQFSCSNIEFSAVFLRRSLQQFNLSEQTDSIVKCVKMNKVLIFLWLSFFYMTYNKQK